MLAGAALALAAVLATLLVVGRGGEEADRAPAVEVLLPEGAASAGGVVVAEPVAEFGHVPLDLTVQHVFHLLNTATTAAEVGRPSVATLDGC